MLSLLQGWGWTIVVMLVWATYIGVSISSYRFVFCPAGPRGWLEILGAWTLLGVLSVLASMTLLLSFDISVGFAQVINFCVLVGSPSFVTVLEVKGKSIFVPYLDIEEEAPKPLKVSLPVARVVTIPEFFSSER